METKKDRNGKVKKVLVNGKSKILYCSPSNRRLDYVKHNKKYVKLTNYKKQMMNKIKRGGVDTNETYNIVVKDFERKHIDKNAEHSVIMSNLDQSIVDSANFLDLSGEGGSHLYSDESKNEILRLLRSNGYVNA